MKLLVKSAFLALILYIIHMIFNILISRFYFDDFGYYGIFGGLLYGFIIGFWAYWLLCFIYVRITKKDEPQKYKYLKASVIIIIGYFLSRIPDMIDQDFFSDFNIWFFAIFIFLIPLLVEFEKLFSKPKKI